MQTTATTKTYLTPDDVLLIISKAKSQRDKLLMTMAWETGARISELLGITPADINTEQSTVIIRHLKDRSKEGDYRPVLLTKDLVGSLEAFIRAVRRRRNDRVFPISRRQADLIIKIAAEDAGFGGKCLLLTRHHRLHGVSFHRLRDAIATAKLEFNGDAVGLELMRQQLGHKKIETTMRYLKMGLADQKRNDEGFWGSLNGAETE